MGFKRRNIALELLTSGPGREVVKGRLAEIDGELSQLEAERKTLGALVRRNGRGNASADQVRAAMAELGADPVSKIAIARHLQISPVRLKKPIEELVAVGVVVRVGRGRGTRYQAVT